MHGIIQERRSRIASGEAEERSRLPNGASIRATPATSVAIRRIRYRFAEGNRLRSRKQRRFANARDSVPSRL